MNVNTLVVDRLRAAGCVFAEDEADLLIAEARTPAELEAMVERRAGGMPLEYVLGWAEFRGLRVVVAPGVFVPRARTEFMVEEAVRLAPSGATTVVVDLCCGSGAIGLALAGELGRVDLFAADLDPEAVRCARVNLSGRGQVVDGDLFEPLPETLRGRVDILTANVPYVPTAEIELMPREARLYEPRLSLDGGDDGLNVVRRVASAAPSWLAPGGHLLVESSVAQAPAVAAIFAASGLSARTVRSEELDATVVTGTRPAR